ncbi:MAG: Asp-tRNA(Asn)/Glu-tRNA(Gln) amidotransferase subunit GatA [Chlorobi bacterium]|nr:Asp-tRNA(Asn)/Glu-tRNA(Gln) amidotransferase subunit GatA [Chlorobiota bacterium]
MVSPTYYQFRQRVLSGEITCRTEVEAAIQRINQLAHLGAFITVCSQEALAAADRCDQNFRNGKARPLEGLILAVKDNISTRGIRTTCASRMLEHFVPVFTATVVERLISAGAIIIGKTNLDEFAMGSSNENSFFGIARNPHDPERVPGGSSGGSAIAVATRMAHVALGSDTGGSIRQPAAFCGVVGFKPTYGRISRYGLVAFASSLDQIGPIASDVADAALVAHIMSGHDRHDSTSVTLPPIAADLIPFAPGKRPRIGIVSDDVLHGCDVDVQNTYAATIARLDSAGYSTVTVHFTSMEAWIPTYYILATAEASSNLARYDGVRYGFRADNPNGDMMTATRTLGFGVEVKRRIMLGTYVLSSGYYDAYYRTAQRARRWICEDYRQIFRQCDVLLLPTTPTPAFRIGEKTTDPLAMYLNDALTVAANLAGIPAISIPAGKNSNGLPIGIQLQSPFGNDEQLLQIAYDIEQCVAGNAS